MKKGKETPGYTVSKKQIGLRISSELLNQIDKLSKHEVRNRSNMVEKLLGEALKARGEK